MNSPFKDKRYNLFSRHLEDTFNCKVYKVTIDAGFSCPNRDGSKLTGGCIFCDDSGSFSQAHSNLISVNEQLIIGIEKQKERFKAQKFIAYFQAYSNTYAPVEKLKNIYDNAFYHPDIVGMSIGTRPDCVDEEKIDLIADYAFKKHVWIEYGLQSIHDKTLNLINRGHSGEDFIKAVELTKNKNINICAHVIIGLPGETGDDIIETAKVLADLKVDGVKIHLLCVLNGTKIEDMYNKEEITLMSDSEYVDIVCNFLEVLPPTTTIHKMAVNGLKKILVAPKFLGEKFRLLNMIDAELQRRDSWQGKFYV